MKAKLVIKRHDAKAGDAPAPFCEVDIDKIDDAIKVIEKLGVWYDGKGQYKYYKHVLMHVQPNSIVCCVTVKP